MANLAFIGALLIAAFIGWWMLRTSIANARRTARPPREVGSWLFMPFFFAPWLSILLVGLAYEGAAALGANRDLLVTAWTWTAAPLIAGGMVAVWWALRVARRIADGAASGATISPARAALPPFLIGVSGVLASFAGAWAIFGGRGALH